jgi:S-formylglutathione hydrolase FrmB
VTVSISLVAWPAVAVATGLLAIALGAVIVAARRGSRLLPVRTAMWALLATSALALALHASGIVPLDIPRWFYGIALVPFIGPALAVSGGRSLRAPLRALAVVCLPLGLVVSVLVVNQHYQYWPTLGALLGKDHTDPLLDPAVALRLAGSDATPVVAAAPDAAARQGRLVDLPIPGTASGFHARTARVWLPPGFLTDPDRPRPVIEMIGGTPSWTSDWTRSARLDRVADEVAAAHGGEAPLIVMVDANGSAFGDTECVGKSEAYLTVDVPAFVEAHFAVPADRAAWAVAGYSEGGTCAVTLALRHPDRFAAFADLAGDSHPDVGGHGRTVHTLFGGSEADFAAHDPASLLAHGSYPQLAGWFGSGRSDGSPRQDTTRLAAAARSAGLTVQEFTGPGGHDFGFVGHALGTALPWLVEQLHVPPPAVEPVSP